MTCQCDFRFSSDFNNSVFFVTDVTLTNYFASDPIFVYLLLMNIFNLIIYYTNATGLID